MQRSTLVALAGLFLLVAGVAYGTARVIQGERAQLAGQFAEARLRQVQEVARIIQEDYQDVAKDLGFIAKLVQTTESVSLRDRQLVTLLALVKEYRIIAAYDSDGNRLLVATDLVSTEGVAERQHKERMARAAQRALRAGNETVEIGPPSAGPDTWFRVFARAYPRQVGETQVAAVAVLVDLRKLLRKVRLVSADPPARLLVLGRRGVPSPLSDPALAREVARAGARAKDGFAELVQAMRAGTSGVKQLPGDVAKRLGLPEDGALAAYVPIPILGARWSVAMLTTRAAQRQRERALVLRLLSASATVCVSLLAFGAYYIVTSRRALLVREQLRHAEHLERLHRRTATILDAIPTGVMAIDGDGCIASVNRALRERLAPDAVGRPLEQAFPEAPAAAVARLKALVQAARKSDRVRSVHGERMTLFGEEGQYSLHAVPLEAGSPEARTLLVIEDVSEVRSLASQLVRAEKLATVGVLAAGIAHEIGTPLGVVRGRAEFLLSKLGRDHAQAPGVQVIVDEIDRITRTIRQLLDFSRVKPALVRPVDVAQVARTVTELLRFEADRRRIRLTVRVDDGTPPVAADADQLQQVLVNLVMNACDACSEGGECAIAASTQLNARDAAAPGDAGESGDETRLPQVRIEVVDNGCGIPADRRLQVFDPFYTSKKRGQGTGLGLTIVAQIVQAHGGQIELESEEGQGTRVTLLWPAAGEQPAAAARGRAMRPEENAAASRRHA